MILHSAKDIGSLVRDRRTQLGLSQSELAERVGVSRVWIVQFEGGKPNAQLGLVLRTLRELNIPLQVDATPSAQAASPGKIDLRAIIDATLKKP